MTLQIILVFTHTFTRPKTFTQGRGSVFDKYLHWPRANVRVKKFKKIYTYIETG